MKTCKAKICREVAGGLCAAVLMVFGAGCQGLNGNVSGLPETPVVHIRLSPMTGFAAVPGRPDPVQLKVLAELLGSGQERLKKPCYFRFELYEFKPLSIDPRGRRLLIWPDFDLTSPSQNDSYWKGYLKSYEFELPLGFAPREGTKYVLELTCQIEHHRFADKKVIECRETN